MLSIRFGFRIFAVVALVFLLGVSSPAIAGPPIYGFADLHAHQFANLGLGGLIIWGARSRLTTTPKKRSLIAIL